METYSILWLVVLIVCGLVEAATAGLFSIWFMVGALLAFICSFFPVPIYGQVAVFLVASLVSIYFLRPLAKRYFLTKVQSTNADRVIGKQGLVTEDILPREGKTGQVKVMGQVWTATSTSGEDIAAGTAIVVREISGVKLIVMPLPPEETD